MPGQISDNDLISQPVIHRVALVERHTVTQPIPAECASADVSAIVVRCAGAAQGWAAAQGLVITATEPYADGTSAAGVRFDVTIGQGVAGHESTRRDGGNVDGWLWSARWSHWADTFHALTRRQRSADQGTDDTGRAQVIPMFPGGHCPDPGDERPVIGSEYGVD